MAYSSYTIKNTIEMINENKIYLPAIQRKFVWKPRQIEKLFDSIMRGYPIGTFLFWSLKEENVNKYTFYKFIQNYHERDNYKNEITPKPELKKNIIGVLDGQQRMSSMYIALQGTYAYKKAYCSWNNDNAFPVRRLYLNLIANNDYENEYEFKFLTEDEANCVNNNNVWFDVRTVLEWGEDPEIEDYYDELVYRVEGELREKIKASRSYIKKNLRILHQRIVHEELISYFEIKEQELDKILDIFIRVNSAGTVLSKSDLLFSTIVAHWEAGRNEIDALVTTLNKKGEGFRVNSDFIMRACLVLTDLPVLFKVEGFKEENILTIKDKWNEIKNALEKAFDIIVDFGFNYENLTSNNAVIPIAYYLINGGIIDSISKKEINKYMINSLIKKVYGNQGDQALAHMREALKSSNIIKDSKFNFVELANSFEMKSRKSLRISDEDIEEILDYKKGAYSFMVLSILYPNLKFGQVKFHQDHIHPSSFFTDAKLKTLSLTDKEVEEWQDLKDKLPNLQLLEGKENESKNNTPFIDWLNVVDSSGNRKINDIIKYKEDNYIDINENEDIKNFKQFYNSRKNILRDEIKSRL